MVTVKGYQRQQEQDNQGSYIIQVGIKPTEKENGFISVLHTWLRIFFSLGSRAKS